MRATCHCGAVQLRVTLSDGLNSIRRCDCSFCVRRGAAAVTALRENVEIVQGSDNLSRYQFGTKTAVHYFCKTCGIYTHHNRRSNPKEVGINAACLDGVYLPDLDPIPWSDGRNHPSDKRS
ncbi:GFA family protein [Oceaniovalibus sp. ACAM 378]|uniref:GFA family protein n=1 Tax=Oceaniovalibus sp. ACAM 378 TaxID=2599923 RepID=UPI0011D6FA65|nr:GFA family protein [Oceaniovalibus sp. ACAM 378]TYB90365.1 GFA family protein [Oceaniovalibus sp. ACAM 378]